MEKILILNGSPRAAKSNSKRYAALFSASCPLPCDTVSLTPRNHAELAAQLPRYSDLLLVFPLYADALPVGLLDFLKYLEAHPVPVEARPVVSVLINCGFLEPAQNEIAVRMIRLFCSRNGYRTGSVLMLGSGEAILDSPFALWPAGRSAGWPGPLPGAPAGSCAPRCLLPNGCSCSLRRATGRFTAAGSESRNGRCRRCGSRIRSHDGTSPRYCCPMCY